MDNKESQNEELLVLQSIYDTKYFIVEQMNPPCGRYSADVQLPDPFCIQIKNTTHCSSQSDIECSVSPIEYEQFEVKYLPPINLHFEYPAGYPSSSPPAYFLSCCWLTHEQMSQLCKHLDSLYLDGNGEVILFQWFQFLKEETLSFLNINSCLDITQLSKYKLKVGCKSSLPPREQLSDEEMHSSGRSLDHNIGPTSKKSATCSKPIMPTVKPTISGGTGERDSRAFLDIADGKILVNLLKDFNEFKKSEYFQESYQVCNVCFSDKQGSEFVTFKSCHHFFCKDCIKSYFELMINEGNVSSLNCPQDKCTTQADGSLVKQIVSKDCFERYDSLLLSRTLDTMSDIAYCPRKACQCPLLVDVEERIGTCPACQFVFCPFCKMAYHGVAPCKFNATLRNEIFNEYLQADANAREEFEKRYGKRIIKSLVDDVLSEKWIGSNSKNCPHCNASIEKTEGCNKMTCFRCGTFFCWLCQRRLNASNPYSHYSDRSSECYDRLFPDDYMDEEFMFEPGAFLNY